MVDDRPRIRIHQLTPLVGNVALTDLLALEREVEPGVYLAYKAARSRLVFNSNELVGGYHQVANAAARNAIPTELRQLGMDVWVDNEQVLYRLVGGVTNGDWTAVDENFTGLPGRYHVVDTLVDRDDLPAQFRREGMLVYVVAVDETYRLVGGITNGDWQVQTTRAANVTYTNAGYPSVTNVQEALDRAINATAVVTVTLIPGSGEDYAYIDLADNAVLHATAWIPNHLTGQPYRVAQQTVQDPTRRLRVSIKPGLAPGGQMDVVLVGTAL